MDKKLGAAFGNGRCDGLVTHTKLRAALGEPSIVKAYKLHPPHALSALFHDLSGTSQGIEIVLLLNLSRISAGPVFCFAGTLGAARFHCGSTYTVHYIIPELPSCRTSVVHQLATSHRKWLLNALPLIQEAPVVLRREDTSQLRTME